MKERNYSFDLMRVIACLMIIGMHAPMPSEHANPLFLNASGYFTAPGLCLFFVISGALLLPVKTDTFSFLKKRFGKVAMPTLCFTLLYLVLNAVNGGDVNWAKSICSIPFAPQGHGVLWFMYTLIGLYLVSPIISRWLDKASKREEEFYLSLWAITMCYPLLKLVLEVNESNTGILYFFSGYLGYFVLGHYLNKYPESLTLRRLILPVALAVAAPVACKLLHLEVDFYSLFWYLSIFVAILTVTIYVLISKYGQKLVGGGNIRSFIVLTSNLSFGIYLIHIAVMRSFLWKLDCIINIENNILQWAAVVTLTFVISWLCAYLISLLPFGDYIIGYKRKKVRG